MKNRLNLEIASLLSIESVLLIQYFHVDPDVPELEELSIDNFRSAFQESISSDEV